MSRKKKKKRVKKRQKFTFFNHWHNLYLGVNALIWVALIIMLFFLSRSTLNTTLNTTGWVLVPCSAVSITSSAVFLKPGRRMAGVILQLIAWLGLVGLSLAFFFKVWPVILILFVPAAVLSLGILMLFCGVTWRKERHLNHAMRRS
ncbi:hypothetical protein GF359_07240 [candidate division WOR-3 bacterium]|uniref:Uncharacterized protein n=1 Tax=candidate division WOR-3 bacterium TaxID=2052148 RepID=A0A9D5QCW3_UNCW3|nr:hypothetical protein [candidate division WOR-3 bacterium]MBD3364994.1 hypothetical protein [candidate division WOR-3 bacterium]